MECKVVDGNNDVVDIAILFNESQNSRGWKSSRDVVSGIAENTSLILDIV